jgi:XTP/dITP diphosphohydrolase
MCWPNPRPDDDHRSGGAATAARTADATVGDAFGDAVQMNSGLVLVLASANPDKVTEIQSVLSSALDVTLLPRPRSVPDVVEDGDTLLDNARLKARALVGATGDAAVADDTGLEVEALGGAPGVYSARYAGEGATYADNVARLLQELDRVAGTKGRRARFRTVALVAFPDGSELWAEGTVAGSIAESARGTNGFGYDPVFVVDGSEGGDGRTFAEMSGEEKDAVSHRGRAFRALAASLAERASR